MSEPDNGAQLYELRIVAEGEVRDADGNLISSTTATHTVEVTEEEAVAILAQQAPARLEEGASS